MQNIHTLWYVTKLLHINNFVHSWYSHPPLPPPGLEGHRSYVWVPHDPPVEEKLPGNFDNNVAEEPNDRKTHIGDDDSEKYIDPHAINYMDLPKSADLIDTHINASEEGVAWVIILLKIIYIYFTHWTFFQ